jgi:hypothetical protein
MSTTTLELLNSVNRSQIAELAKAGKDLDPKDQRSFEPFGNHVRDVQAAIIHTYQITAFASVREPDPESAAKMWKEMSTLCELALTTLATLRDKYPGCGTSELYDLTLDYKSEADKRYQQNLQDSEWAKTPVPDRLFPKTK